MSVLPGILREVFHRFESTTEAFNGLELLSAIGAFAGSHPDRSEIVEHALLAERRALQLCGDRDGGASATGTYFGPKFMIFGQADAGIPGFGPEVIEYWRGRCDETSNPLFKARYADAVWDLSELVTGRRAEHRYAQLA